MKVWDLPTRLFHWLQVLLVIILLVSGFTGNGPHEPIGLILLSLLIWRFAWGVLGSETSRFSSFVCSPKLVWRYILGDRPVQIGHNPIGGWMAILLLSLLTIQCITGLLLAEILDVTIANVEWLKDTHVVGLIHGFCARAIIILVAIHVLAIFIHKFTGTPLVKAMFTGESAYSLEGKNPKFCSNLRAMVIWFGALSFIVWLVAFG